MKKSIHIIAIISRLLVGLVFLFSGLVKAIDPLGSNYKFVDYFNAFGLPWLNALAFFLAFLLFIFEFTIGLCLLMFIHKKFASWAALLFMAFFTPLTLWLAISNPIQDCGCFGDAWVLSNWDTFYKNLIILSLTLLTFIDRNAIIRWTSARVEWNIAITAALVISLFAWLNYQHLPMVDFRPYKVGTHIPDKMTIPQGAPSDVYEQMFTLKDTISGKEITIESTQYMNDSSYWCKATVWKFMAASQPKLIKKGYQPPIHDFSITSLSGEDITQRVLTDSTACYFLLIAYDLKLSNTRHQTEINKLYQQVTSNGHHFMCLTAATSNDMEEFKLKHQPPYSFYLTDPITLKTIIRANPGLVLIKNGTIRAKWHSNDIPDFTSIKSEYNLN